MSRLVRKLNKRLHFDKQLIKELGGVPADALSSFETKENSLSIYRLGEEVTLERVLAAISVSGGHVQNVDYSEFDDALLDSCGIKLHKVPGTTPDALVNDAHLDLVTLTVGGVCGLVEKIADQGTTGRLPKSKIKEQLLHGLKENAIDRAKLQPEILKALGE